MTAQLSWLRVLAFALAASSIRASYVDDASEQLDGYLRRSAISEATLLGAAVAINVKNWTDSINCTYVCRTPARNETLDKCHDYEEKTCSGHGVCKKLVETYSCKCFAGWANDKADCDTEPTLNFFLCILFAWIGSTFESLGLTIQKLYFNKEEQKDNKEEQKDGEGDADASAKTATDTAVVPAAATSGEISLNQVKIDTHSAATANRTGVSAECKQDASALSAVALEQCSSTSHATPPDETAARPAHGADADAAPHRKTAHAATQRPRFCIPGLPGYLYMVGWWFGFLIFAFGNAFAFGAFGLGKQSLVTLISAWGLAFNGVTAKFLLKEIFTIYDGLSVVAVIGGIVLTVVASPHATKEWELDELMGRYTVAHCPECVAVIAVVCIITFLHIVIVWIYEDRHAKLILSWQNGGEQGPKPLLPKAISFMMCTCGAFIAVLTVLFAKSVSEMMLASFAGDNQFKSIYSFIVLFVFVATLFGQLHWIAKSLQINPALFHLPTYYVIWNIGSIISGGIFYAEFAGFYTLTNILFPIGIFVLFAGVGFASYSETYKEKQKAAEQMAQQTVGSSHPWGHGEATADAARPSLQFAAHHGQAIAIGLAQTDTDADIPPLPPAAAEMLTPRQLSLRDKQKDRNGSPSPPPAVADALAAVARADDAPTQDDSCSDPDVGGHVEMAELPPAEARANPDAPLAPLSRRLPPISNRDGAELSPADCSEELVEQREKSKYASPHGLDSPFKKPEGSIRLPTEPLTPIRPNLEVCEAEC